MKVVLAPVGTKMLEEDFIIQKSKIRGVESEGMLCSEKEIGFGINSDGIIQLEEKAKVGNLLSTLFPSPSWVDPLSPVLVYILFNLTNFNLKT